ncbi:Fiber protein Fb34 [Quillaja saponaria]|uniref:Fiber protein Fb34 n=1 Tax=Quillaja saponaria TaxID=32244 RepID=A0AAD7KP99_QUISA|nr:Fiber protein Fb34 [Quillaja saponaria]
MAVSVPILAIVISLNLIAFIFAVGAERRRSKAKVVNDEYDEHTYCVYASDASTVYGLLAFGLLLISQTVVHGVTKCLCFGKGLVTGCSTTVAIFFFILSWISFLGAEACLLAGSARNAYHTKYRGVFGTNDLSCATLRKGVFAAGAALTLLSLLGSVLYYWTHSKADTGGWQKYQNEGIGLATSTFPHHQQQEQHHQQGDEFQKV